MGGQDGAGRPVSALHPPLQQPVHRSPPRKVRQPRPNHLWTQHRVHLGRPGHEPVSTDPCGFWHGLAGPEGIWDDGCGSGSARQEGDAGDSTRV